MANDGRHNRRPQSLTQGQITFAQRILRWIADALGPAPASEKVTCAQRILRAVADAIGLTPTAEKVTRLQRILRRIADALGPAPTGIAGTEALQATAPPTHRPFLTQEEVRLFEVMN